MFPDLRSRCRMFLLWSALIPKSIWMNQNAMIFYVSLWPFFLRPFKKLDKSPAVSSTKYTRIAPWWWLVSSLCGKIHDIGRWRVSPKNWFPCWFSQEFRYALDAGYFTEGWFDFIFWESFKEHFLGNIIFGLLSFLAVVEFDLVNLACVGKMVP